MILAAQLAAIRANAAAIAAQCDAILAALAPAASSSANGACQHPPEQRLAAPRMGTPTAWICRACGMSSEVALVATTGAREE